MAQIETIATSVRLSDTAHMIAHPAEDICNREERVRRAVPYMDGWILCTADLTAAAQVQGLP
jgi:hypothetical protein